VGEAERWSAAHAARMAEEHVPPHQVPSSGPGEGAGRSVHGRPGRNPDVRLPAVAVVPQFLAPLAVAGDAQTARLVFLIVVAANVPIALAGRVLIGALVQRQATSSSAERWISSGAAEWSRTVAAWTYAGVLVLLLPYALTPLDRALRVSAVVVAAVGVLAYVVPGRSTPAGLRLALRIEAVSSWSREAPAFTLGRASRILPFGVVPALVAGRPGIAFAVMLAAATAALLAASIRPPNTAGYESRRSEQESMF